MSDYQDIQNGQILSRQPAYIIPILWHRLIFLDYLVVENEGSRLLRNVEKYLPVDVALLSKT
jgi:hypothetical protein